MRFFLSVLIFLASTMATVAETPDKFVQGFPHVNEFDASLNPEGKFWCGHAVLASALKQLGRDADIKSLHEAFAANSAGYRADTYCPGKSCAKVQDLMWAAQKQYGLPYSQSSLPRTSADLLQKVKDAVKFGRGVIVPSNYGYRDEGHFWLIVGYKENTSNVDHSVLFMRDMAKSSPQGQHWDTEAVIGKFVYNTDFGGKIPYLIIKD